ncbi:acyl-CoA dehydrogenase family protein [Streptomyces sp. NBC_00075]|uniref:acyl-CoA dehydrogenase family protein n=1 Tax=Streptomyces sp. NBC_00075 TaxID=2975641 RepID=UPI00325056F5
MGEVNGGWKVITDSLAGERIAMGDIAAVLHRQLDDLLAHAREDSGTAVGPRGSHARALVTELAVGVQATRVLVAAGLRAAGGGTVERLAAPMAGVLAGELPERSARRSRTSSAPTPRCRHQHPACSAGGLRVRPAAVRHVRRRRRHERHPARHDRPRPGPAPLTACPGRSAGPAA